jgi:hypothetical protein
MCVGSYSGQALKGDIDRRPARELFQSLEVYLICSGYEALVSSPQQRPQPDGGTLLTHSSTKAS